MKSNIELSSRMFGRVGIYFLFICVTIIILGPLSWMLGTSLKPFEEVLKNPASPIPSHLVPGNYVKVFSQVPFLLYLLNTVKVSLVCCLGTLVTSSMAAYAFARLDFPGRNILFLLYLGTLMVPRQVVLVPNFIIFRTLGLLDTHWSLILTGIFTAYGTFLLRQFFLSIPKELEEAAVIDGYGYGRRFLSIILPLSKPALVTLFIITLLNIWNEFLYALIFINTDFRRTLTLGLALLTGDFDVQWNLVMAATTLALMPLILAFLLLQRFFIEGIALTGIKA